MSVDEGKGTLSGECHAYGVSGVSMEESSLMEFPDGRLLVFAKAPLPGRVKTRLIPMLGARGAARFYVGMARHVISVAVQVGCPVELWCAPDSSHPFFAGCRHDFGITLRAQRGGDLGDRMYHALRTALRESRYAVIIGTDCPTLTTHELRGALNTLRQGTDVVLGSALDGGYVLIGLRQPLQALFAAIPWSSPRVMEMTRRRLSRLGARWYEMESHHDIDSPRDVRFLKRAALRLLQNRPR